MKLSKNSSEAIDLIRFPLAVMVVFIHSFWEEPTQEYLTSLNWTNLTSYEAFNLYRFFFAQVFPQVAVPAFFLISGYLFFNGLECWRWDVWKRKIRSRIRTLFLPYVIWVTFFIIYNKFGLLYSIVSGTQPMSIFFNWLIESGGFHLYWDSSVREFDYPNLLGGSIVHSTGPYCGHLWFLRDLIFATAITPLLYWLIKKTGFAFILVLTIAYFTKIWPDIHGLHLMTAFFFSLGSYISLAEKDLMLFFRNYKKIIISGALFFLLLSTYFMIGPHAIVRFYVIDYYMLFGVASLFIFSYHLVSNVGLRKQKILVDSCFFVYVLHPVVLHFTYRLFTLFYTGSLSFLLPVNYFMLPIATSLVCVVVYFVLNKLFPRFTAVLSGGR